jgi:YwiC-like protein
MQSHPGKPRAIDDSHQGPEDMKRETAPSGGRRPPLAGGPAGVSTGDTPRAEARSTIRSAAVPREHGGWGITLEPALLGLIVAPSAAGFCLGAAAMLAFVARTPLRVLLVDLHRHRWLDRTRVAAWIFAGELALLAGLLVAALVLAKHPFWVPVVVAGPLVVVEFWFEARSRSRRLVPELAGAVGVCSVTAMIVLASGGSGWLATGLWLILAARTVTSIPHVRDLIARLHGRPRNAMETVVADCAALAMAIAAVWLDRELVAGAVAVTAVVAIQRLSLRRPVPRPAAIGIRQIAMGWGVVVVTAIGVLAMAS